ncbi:hypothetical protein [Listeria valentina]|uniref:hypothetical protein n=1 Tax=Listeria valentina TaxID=2705293 RepID=UPI00143191E4|nr:hypothetical protein [Listeria valentina]
MNETLSYLGENRVYLTLKDIMEFVALLATIIAVISIWIGINQLKIMRDEKNVNEKRMLTEYSIKVLGIFASTLIPAISVYYAKTKEGKANLDKNVPDREGYSKNRFKMQNKRKLDQHQLTEIVLCGKYDCGNILNVFEHTCVYITNDLVDEDIVYPLSTMCFWNLLNRMLFFWLI